DRPPRRRRRAGDDGVPRPDADDQPRQSATAGGGAARGPGPHRYGEGGAARPRGRGGSRGFRERSLRAQLPREPRVRRERDRLAGTGRCADRHPVQEPRPTAAREHERRDAPRGQVRQRLRRAAAAGSGRCAPAVAAPSDDAPDLSAAGREQRRVSAKHLRLIALGLVVLLLLWGGSELLSRGSDSVTGSLALPALSVEDVDTISVVKGTDSIMIVKQSPTAWSVNGHRAALDAVGELFQVLADSARLELVAQAPSSFARLGVDSPTGHWLRLARPGKPPLELIIGTHTSGFQSAYLRRPGDAHVYLRRGRLGSVLERTVDGWRDKRIAVLAHDSIVALDVVRGKDRYVLRRAGARWTINGQVTDSAALARYLDRLTTIAASAFATPVALDSVKARAVRRLTVRGAHGVLLTLAFDSTGSGFLVHHVAGAGGEGATMYLMTFWDVDGLTPASRSLKK